ncbi:MAG TPA: N-acetylglucosamine-6-phosphate deacetylase [Clostridia bacterium]|jgi:N-acetylglucosamine-6-phosphate deacetylase|nr:N-acetylglucosamine-6-phosphate deacetylase [Clostridiaceae bacterium]HOF26680.1 N-acetylglucosamine-6-phosphate deacetylase [Clostridia bacterium]HOM35283.1 N-acetylglucosamine-6-phosphate deacetylase [Clostridia bacterium]HOR89808.1 N-acetylglucosamine-6-phosphate deacetylase [Clostridia bacterium]HOT71595.1 N-acetylglucosamine-6-phosphate deacetylase [Clostridia bacterium]
MRTIIYNGKLILKDTITEQGHVEITDGVITNVSQHNPNHDLLSHADNIIDAKGMHISPGFIDIHTHGGGGYDFGVNSTDSYIVPCEIHARHGTTSLYPTISSATFETMEEAVVLYKEAKYINYSGATMRGLHFEGPYFSPAQKGAQSEEHLRTPKPFEYLKILNMTDDIKRWSSACELDGMQEFTYELKKRGILPAIGHCDATYEEVKQAQEWGFSLITHLYSCCSTITRDKGYRILGVTEAAYLIDDMDVEIICDGHHLPDGLIQMVYRFIGPDRTAIITDCLSYAGLDAPDGTLLGDRFVVEGGVAKLLDRSAFAGSIATFDMLIRTALKAGLPLKDIIKMSSVTPARIMGIDKQTGSLEKGKEADVIVFDNDINMHAVFVKGKRVL